MVHWNRVIFIIKGKGYLNLENRVLVLRLETNDSRDEKGKNGHNSKNEIQSVITLSFLDTVNSFA
jgi:hypothetical protein